MSTCRIWTDLSQQEQDKIKDDFLSTASPGDIIIYQGPNQMDQTRYEVVIKEGKKELKWTHSSCEDYDCY